MSDATTRQLTRSPLLADKLAQRLRREIAGGRYKPNEKLPTERELAESHGVSRPIVREAMGRLKQDGLVVSRQGSGAFVADGTAAVFRLEPAEAGGTGEIANIVELLLAVESAASGHAAARRSPAQMAAIRARFDAMDAAIAEGRPGIDEDVAFHRTIAEATGNPVFRDMVDFLDGRVRLFIGTARTNSAREGLTRQVQSEHRAILDAIVAGDEDGARKASADHLKNALARLARRSAG
ncbi:MAG: FadR/GntR family transcriptional regulator [Alphaproteobacteria bacterium]